MNLTYCTCKKCVDELILGDLLPKIIQNDKEFFFDAGRNAYFDINDRKLLGFNGPKCFYCSGNAPVVHKKLEFPKTNVEDMLTKRMNKIREKVEALKNEYRK